MASLPIVSITHRETFSVYHRLQSKILSDEENLKLYGKWTNGHSHHYVVLVTVKGPVDPKTGMVMKVHDLKQDIKQAIIEPLDNKNLDKEVPYFETMVSTKENLAIFIWERLQRIMDKPHLLHEVKLLGSKKNHVVYRGSFTYERKKVDSSCFHSSHREVSSDSD